MKKIKYWVRDYFAFSQNETNGVVFLVGFMILIGIAFNLHLFMQKSISLDLDNHSIAQLDSILKQIPPKKALKPIKKHPQGANRHLAEQTKKYTLFPINPNQASLEEWLKTGLSKRVAQNILKYRAKGGRFRKKSDLAKIYGFPSDLYNRLLPYLLIPTENIPPSVKYSQKETKKHQNWKVSQTKQVQKFEINQANQAQLKAIRGIGEVLSKRIIAYRKKLGGFVNWKQLHEVWNLKSEVIDELRNSCYLDTKMISKIFINVSTFSELEKHPYISENVARSIVNYREQHGAFKEISELLNLKLINSNLLHKLAPYLSI